METKYIEAAKKIALLMVKHTGVPLSQDEYEPTIELLAEVIKVIKEL